MVAPQVHSVDPGPPVTLLVHMLSGQVADDFETNAHRLAAGMDVPWSASRPAVTVGSRWRCSTTRH
jgi:hypothetical protein